MGKSVNALFLSLILLFFMSGHALALTYNESYAGDMVVANGENLTFDFDFRHINSPSSLFLISDASGMESDEVWLSSSLSIVFSLESEAPRHVVISLDSGATQTTNFILGSPDYEWVYDSGTDRYTYTYMMTDGLISAFEPTGQGSINVGSLFINEGFNDFTINMVAMDVITDSDNSTPAPVPEPATMLLLGTGLVGLAGFRKKKK